MRTLAIGQRREDIRRSSVVVVLTAYLRSFFAMPLNGNVFTLLGDRKALHATIVVFILMMR